MSSVIRSGWIVEKNKCKRRAIRQKCVALSAALAPLLLVAHSQAQNTVYTYTPTSASTDDWSTGTNWSPSAPSPSTSTELAFGTGAALINSFTNVNTDDISGVFNLNAMDLNGTSTAGSGVNTVTINALAGNSLNFTGTTPTINLNADGTGLTYTINAPFSLAANTSANCLGTATFNFAGNISGAANLTFTNLSTTLASTVIGISGTNSYTGVTNVEPGNPTAGGSSNPSGGSTITVTVSGNQTAANGGWNISEGQNNNFGLAFVNFSSGSQIAVAGTGFFQIGAASASGNTMGVNVAGTVTDAGPLRVQRSAVFNISSGGVWNQSGAFNISNPGGGNSDSMTVLSGGIFNYNGSTAIPIQPSQTGAGKSTLILAGLFNTTQGFLDIGSPNTGSSTLQMSGGTLLTPSTATIATLVPTPLVVSLSSGTFSSFNISGAGANSINYNISGSGTIGKAGPGILTFSGLSNYTGATNLSGGTLAITTATSLPATTVMDFANSTAPITLNITGLNQSIGGMVFQTQLASTNNTVTILGNSSTSLMDNPAVSATTTIAPFNASGNMTLDMSSLGTFVYNGSTGNTFTLSTGTNAGVGGAILVKLASTIDSITAGALNLGSLGSQTSGIGTPSTLILGTNTNLNVNTLTVGNSGSRATGYLNAGTGTLNIGGTTGGTTNLTIGRADSTTTTDIETSVMDTSFGTLNASFGTVTIGLSVPTVNQTSSRGVTINGIFNMGAGTLTANSLLLGELQNATSETGNFTYTWLLNGSFNMTGGTATIPTITLGTNQYIYNFNSTTGTVVNAQVALNGGATLYTTNVAQGSIATYNSGSLTINSLISWSNGTIANIPGNGLGIIGADINLYGPTAYHAFNIASGQTGTIDSLINGSGGFITLGGGTLYLGSSNTYSGPTNISNGTVVAGLNSAATAGPLGNGSDVSLANAAGAALNLSNYNVAIGSLTGGGINGGSINLGTGSLTVGGSGVSPPAYAGTIFGTGGLNKIGPETLILTGSNSYTGGTNVSGGVLSLGSVTALPLGNLTVTTGGLVVATKLGASYALQVNMLNVSGGTIDLQNNDMVIHSTNIAAVWSALQQGYNGGGWNGTSGILSTPATSDSAHLTALGVMINDAGANTGAVSGTAIYGTFSQADTSTVDGDVLVKFTYYGDANLSGSIDGSDYSLVDSAYSYNETHPLTPMTGWYNGDFNYDGVVDGSDYTLMDNAFNNQGAAIASAVATAQIGTTAVPEPTTFGLLGVGAMALLGRRRGNFRNIRMTKFE